MCEYVMEMSLIDDKLRGVRHDGICIFAAVCFIITKNDDRQ